MTRSQLKITVSDKALVRAMPAPTVRDILALMAWSGRRKTVSIPMEPDANGRYWAVVSP